MMSLLVHYLSRNCLKKSIKIELIFAAENTHPQSFSSEIKEICDDKIIIASPVSNTADFSNINIFAQLNGIIYTQDGVLTSNVNLLEKNYGENNDAVISFPYNNQFCQRREDTRIPMHIDFELNIADRDIFLLKTKNISGKGLACITSEALPDFSNAQMVLHLPTGDLTALCRKVYSQKLKFNDLDAYLNGIAFTEISQENINTIVKECLKFQLTSKHNERLFETL